MGQEVGQEVGRRGSDQHQYQVACDYLARSNRLLHAPLALKRWIVCSGEGVV